MDIKTKACLIDGNQGIYVPQAFIRCYQPEKWAITSEDVEMLKAGPDHEHYWDTWDTVLAYAKHTDERGYIWTLHQDDGDLFAIRDDHTWEDD